VKSGSPAGGASKRVLRSNSKDFLRFRGYVISDEFFICTRFAQKSPSRNSAGQACPLYRALSTVGRLCEKKKRRTRAKPPSRKGLRKSNRAHHNFFAFLRLCEKKKEKK
jgi:hypothetical protein